MKVRKREVEITAEQFTDYYTRPDSVVHTDDGLVVYTLEGPYEINEGDWIITGVKGERYPTSDERFRLLYEHIEGDRYRSKPMIRDAIKMPNRFTIHCSGGDLTGNAGDWLMLATPDDAYPVEAAIFERTYDVVEEAA